MKTTNTTPARKIVVIGGVAGGATAAARLRRLDENAQITILEKGPYVSFANCGLPYFVGDVIKNRGALELMSPALFHNRFNIDVRIHHEALHIDREKKQVQYLERQSGRQDRLDYDFLVLSPGATPIVPPVPGSRDADLFTVRTIPDVEAIKAFIRDKKVERAVVVGGGFIGLEMAENLRALNIKVTLLEMAEQVMLALDYEMAQFVHQELQLNGVELVLGDGLSAFSRQAGTNIVQTRSGKSFPADLIILAIGVVPDTGLARECGLALGPKGHILVDRRLTTSDPAIYAVGDAVAVEDYISQAPLAIPLAGPANKQGRIAAENIAGRHSSYEGAIGTSIVKVFNLDVGAVGKSEKSLAAAPDGDINKNFEKIYVHPHNHAGYYPGSTPLTIKLLFRKPDGLLLGAQIVGSKGVDKRLDVLATSLRLKATVFDLEKLELAYAPPFGSAKDPINMAGFVAANVLRGDMPVVHWSEINTLKEKGAYLLDVRTKQEFGVGHIPGAVNIPDTELRRHLAEIPRDQPVLVYCQVGFRGYLATRTLLQQGFADVRNLTGGYRLYHTALMPEHELRKLYTMAQQKMEQKMEQEEQEEQTGRPLDAASRPSLPPIAAELDLSGLQCPGPILQLAGRMKELAPGSTLKVTATDQGFATDLPAWCRTTGHELLALNRNSGRIEGMVRKVQPAPRAATGSNLQQELPHDKAIILFSGELDKALAAFIIANGAAAMGRKVTIFATFWGLNVLKQDRKPARLRKNFIEKMFGLLLPRGAKKITLSQLHMLGMGTQMIKGIMKKHRVDELEVMIAKALQNGVRVVACQMSMELMGIKQEELLAGVETGGVASFLEAAEQSDTSLFIS